LRSRPIAKSGAKVRSERGHGLDVLVVNPISNALD
jgi:hypothetical protein